MAAAPDLEQRGPVRFLVRTGLSSFALTPEGLSACQALPPGSPISVVFVAGPARQGKSTLLCWLCREHGTSFHVGHETVSDTRGLWLWTHRPAHALPSDPTFLFIDCEGLGSVFLNDEHASSDVEQTQLVLGLLLASVFVFNKTGELDETTVASLAVLGQCVARVTAAQAGEAAAALVPLLMPRLVLVLRDTYLHSLVRADGPEQTDSDLLELCLKPKSASATGTHDATRAHLRACFPCRECWRMPLPSTDPAQLRSVSEAARTGALSPGFVKRMDAFVAHIWRTASIVPLRDPVSGAFVDGRGFASRAADLVALFNDNPNAIPRVPAQWESLKLVAAQQSVAGALNTYEQAMLDALQRAEPEPLSEAEFVAEHKRSLALALVTFHRTALGDAAFLAGQAVHVLRVIGSQVGEASLYARLSAMNYERSRAFCGEVLQAEWARLAARAEAGDFVSIDGGGLVAFDAACEQLIASYEARARGPAAQVVQHDLFANAVWPLREGVLCSDAALSEAQKREAAAACARACTEADAMLLQKKLSDLARLSQTQQEDHALARAALQEHLERESLASLDQERKRLESIRRQCERAKTEQLRQQARDLLEYETRQLDAEERLRRARVAELLSQLHDAQADQAEAEREQALAKAQAHAAEAAVGKPAGREHSSCVVS